MLLLTAILATAQTAALEVGSEQFDLECIGVSGVNIRRSEVQQVAKAELAPQRISIDLSKKLWNFNGAANPSPLTVSNAELYFELETFGFGTASVTISRTSGQWVMISKSEASTAMRYYQCQRTTFTPMAANRF